MTKKKSVRSNSKKLQTMVLSIFLSVIVWFMVVYINDPDITTTISDLNIRFAGEAELRDKGFVITGREDIPSLSIVVTGKRSDLMNYMDDICVDVDVYGMAEEGNYNLEGLVYMPTTRINLEKEKYDNIPIKVEKLVEKDIPVIIKQTGSISDKLVQSLPKNSTMKIKGAVSEIDRVDHAEATVDISTAYDGESVRVGYVLVDSSGVLIKENETIESLTHDIDVYNTIYDVKTMSIEPVLTGDMEQKYILNKENTVVIPQEIQVGVRNGNETDRLNLNIYQLSEDDYGEYEIEVPDGVYIPEERKKVNAHIDVKEKVIKDVEFEVGAVNVPQDKEIEMDNKVIAQIWSDRDNISAEDIHATVDLSGLGVGTHKLPVKIEGNNIGLQSEFTVYVTIR